MADSGSEGSRSLSPSKKESIFEHERLYQKLSIDRQIYCVPIDDARLLDLSTLRLTVRLQSDDDQEEELRVEIQDRIVNKLFGQKLFFADIDYPDRVLDCGYGQAHWVLSVAEQYEDCRVDGIDIYPLDLPDVPENLHLYYGDLNERLIDSYPVDTYDLVQSRFVAPGIHKQRWGSYVRELMRLLKPGGTLQMMEYYYNFQSRGGMLGTDNALFQWGDRYRRAVSPDRDPRIGSADPRAGGRSRLSLLLEDAGLQDVQQRMEELPIGDWPTEQRQKQIGRENLQNIDRLLDSFGTWPFIERQGMTREEVGALNDRAREELRDPRIRAYIPLTIVWGRRPPG